MSAAWLPGGAQISTKSRSSRASKSSTVSCHRPSGTAPWKASRRDATASVAATIFTSSRTRQPGTCPCAATLPKPMNAPLSTWALVEGKPARDRGERLVEDVHPKHRFVLSEDKRRIDADDIGIGHGDEAALQ